MSSTKNFPVIVETDLRYLAIASRAAEHNNNLWAEAANTLRRLIDAFDALLPEAGAAEAQAKLNRIAQLATRSGDYAINRTAELIDELAFTAWAGFVITHYETSN